MCCYLAAMLRGLHCPTRYSLSNGLMTRSDPSTIEMHCVKTNSMDDQIAAGGQTINSDMQSLMVPAGLTEV